MLALVFSILVGLHAHRFDARVLATFGFLVFAAVLMGCAFHAEDDVRADRRAGADPGDRAAVLLHSADRRDAVAFDDRLAAASNSLCTLSAAFGTAMSVTLWDNRATYHYDVVSQSVTHVGEHATLRAHVECDGRGRRAQLSTLRRS